MICIILRNIDTETTDYDLLLFGYLKVQFIVVFYFYPLLTAIRLRVACGIDHSAY